MMVATYVEHRLTYKDKLFVASDLGWKLCFAYQTHYCGHQGLLFILITAGSVGHI